MFEVNTGFGRMESTHHVRRDDLRRWTVVFVGTAAVRNVGSREVCQGVVWVSESEHNQCTIQPQAPIKCARMYSS